MQPDQDGIMWFESLHKVMGRLNGLIHENEKIGRRKQKKDTHPEAIQSEAARPLCLPRHCAKTKSRCPYTHNNLQRDGRQRRFLWRGDFGFLKSFSPEQMNVRVSKTASYFCDDIKKIRILVVTSVLEWTFSNHIPAPYMQSHLQPIAHLCIHPFPEKCSYCRKSKT